MFDEEQAQFVCDFLECLTCSSGVPLRLMDWQRSMITEFYGQLIEDEDDPAGSYLRRYQYLYLEIARERQVGNRCRSGCVPPVCRRRD